MNSIMAIAYLLEKTARLSLAVDQEQQLASRAFDELEGYISGIADALPDDEKNQVQKYLQDIRHNHNVRKKALSG